MKESTQASHHRYAETAAGLPLHRVSAFGLAVEYGPTSEPWQVRRFYIRDPLGRLVNMLVHE